MDLQSLKAQIAAIEQRVETFTPCHEGNGVSWQFGLHSVDKALPGGSLAHNGLHDFSCDRPRDTASAAVFMLLLLNRYLLTGARRHGVIWCQTAFNEREHGGFYGPGLAELFLSPENFLIIRLRKEQDLAFALEAAINSRVFAAVVGEGPPVGFTPSRRLSMACRKTATPCLFLNSAGDRQASAATTRWRLAPAVGPPDPHDIQRPGALAWSLSLTRALGGAPGKWTVFWNDETDTFDLASPFYDGAVGGSAPKDFAVQSGDGRSRKAG